MTTPDVGAFARASAVTRIGDGELRAEVPDGWQQGRGAFGGLVLGTLARAMIAEEPDGSRALRTISGDLAGPVLPGGATVRVRTLRRGAHQSNFFAELTQGGGDVLATATAILGHARPSIGAGAALAGASPARTLRPAEAMEPLPIGPPLAPVFAPRFEYRSDGPLPFSGASDATVTGWIREREPLARVDAPALIARLDAWWPAALALLRAPRAMATVSFLAELLVDPADLAPDEPLAYRARLAGHHDGYFVELRELWRGDHPVALNQQTFAVLR